jgi:hypothetical protein
MSGDWGLHLRKVVDADEGKGEPTRPSDEAWISVGCVQAREMVKTEVSRR